MIYDAYHFWKHRFSPLKNAGTADQIRNQWCVSGDGNDKTLSIVVELVGFRISIKLPADTNQIQANRALATALRTLANKIQRYTPVE